MKKKHNKKNKIEKTSLTRNAAYSEARLGDWGYCVRKAFHGGNYDNIHYNTLISLCTGFNKGFRHWVLQSIITNNIWQEGVPLKVYKYNIRTTIFQ